MLVSGYNSQIQFHFYCKSFYVYEMLNNTQYYKSQVWLLIGVFLIWSWFLKLFFTWMTVIFRNEDIKCL